MIITKLALPRRTFLRGLGATLALPVLDAMVPAFGGLSAAAAPVRRLGVVYIPMGSNIAEWMPKQEGTLTELSPTLSPDLRRSPTMRRGSIGPLSKPILHERALESWRPPWMKR